MSRVLLVRLSAMGDLVQSLGAIEALARQRPDLRPCVLTQASLVPLLATMSGVCTVVAHDRRGGFGALARTRRALQALRCDVALDLQGNWKSAMLAWLSGARIRIGMGSAGRQEPASRWLLTRLIAADGPVHPTQVAATLVHTVAPDVQIAGPRLVATAAEIERAAQQLTALGVSPGQPFKLVSVAPVGDPRGQSAAALARELREASRSTVVLLGPSALLAEVPSGARVLRHQAGSLRELVGLGALLAQVGGEAIGPDHGPMHVLAAAGAVVRVLFGPEAPELTAPPSARVLRHATPPSCMPCRQRRCSHPRGPVCMDFSSDDGVEQQLRPWSWQLH